MVATGLLTPGRTFGTLVHVKGNSDPLTDAIQRTVTAAVEQALEQHSRPVQREALTVREAAEAVGRSRQWVYDRIAAGEIPAKRFGCGSLLVPVAGLREALTA